MSALRLTDRERLAVLSAAVLDTLDELYTESELDRDDNPPQTALYNLAAAMEDAVRPYPTTGVPGLEQQRNRALRATHEGQADELATEALSWGEGRLEHLRGRLLEGMGR